MLIESKLGIGNYKELEDTIKLKWIENTEKDKDISTSRLWSMDTEKEKTPIKEKLAFKKLVLEGIKISPYFKENSIQSPSSPLKTEDSYNLDFLVSNKLLTSIGASIGEEVDNKDKDIITNIPSTSLYIHVFYLNLNKKEKEMETHIKI